MPIKRDRNRERFAQKPIDESHTWLLSDSTVQISSALNITSSDPEELPRVTTSDSSIGVQSASPLAWDDLGRFFLLCKHRTPDLYSRC